MKECRCHKKGTGINPEMGMTQSINFEESPADAKFRNSSHQWIQSRKRDIMMQSQTNFSTVSNNKQLLKEKKVNY